MLLRLLMADRNGLFELRLIAVCETIPWCRTADRGKYVRCLPACMKCMAALQLKQPKFYKCLVFDRYDSEISIKQLRQLLHMSKLPKIILKNATNISTGRVHMCIFDRYGTTDRRGTPMDYADRRFQQWPVGKSC